MDVCLPKVRENAGLKCHKYTVTTTPFSFLPATAGYLFFVFHFDLKYIATIMQFPSNFIIKFKYSYRSLPSLDFKLSNVLNIHFNALKTHHCGIVLFIAPPPKPIEISGSLSRDFAGLWIRSLKYNFSTLEF